MTCAVHRWVDVTPRTVTVRYKANGRKKKKNVPTVEVWCLVCGEKAPPEKKVIRLVVLNRLVECPYGFGTRKLHDCYLDSITPGHRCVDPQREGAARCPAVRGFVKRFGWRTWYRSFVTEHTRYGAMHVEKPLQLIYVALDALGTRWMAVNQRTGQRVHVRLDGSGERWTHSGGAWTSIRSRPVRLTPDGHPIEQTFRMTSYTTGRPVTIEPYWNGVPSEDQWSACACRNCLEAQQRVHKLMTWDEYRQAIGAKQTMSVTPIAQKDKPIGDPHKCTECRYARCKEHRMVFLPPTNSSGQRIIAHAGDFKRSTSAPAPVVTPATTTDLDKAGLVAKKFRGRGKR